MAENINTLKASHREQLRELSLASHYNVMTQTLEAWASSPDKHQNQRADAFVAAVVDQALRVVTSGREVQDDPSELRQAALAFECLRFTRFVLLLN